MKRNMSLDKMMAMSQRQKSKKGGNCFDRKKDGIIDTNNKRFLITVNVLGSAGPLRFLVNEEDLVADVIDTALKVYAKEGRLPMLGTDSRNLLLYCANAGFDALSEWDEIGASGVRNFVLCKKPVGAPNMTEARSNLLSHKRSNGSWKAWLNKSLTFKISSH